MSHNQAVATRPATNGAVAPPEGVEAVLIGGDLSKLSSSERLDYYQRLCHSLGLNALTRPFQYVTLSGKLTLYATKDCSEQLRKKNGVSITDLETSILPGDLYQVKAHARDATGKVDVATGVLSIKGLTGENLANAMMKAETKAKRRVTLSISGLGMLDETEADFDDGPSFTEPTTIQQPRRRSEKPQAVDTVTGEITDAPPPLWTKQELNAGLQAATITVHDLSPILGQPATRENYAELIDTWMFEHPGKRISDLIAAAIAHHTSPPAEPQAALLSAE